MRSPSGFGRSLRVAAVAGATALLLPTAGPASAAVEATYVVTFAASPGAQELEMLRGVARGVHAFHNVPAASVVLPVSLVPLLRNLPGVRGVWANESYELLDLKANQTIRADQVWGSYGGGLGYTGDGITGAGIGIGVIDAGVDGTHPDLCAQPVFCKGTPVKTVQNVKFVGNTDKLDPVVAVEDVVNTDTSSGHGSHVAGIAAGYGTASVTPGRYQGVAPGAHVVGMGAGEAIEVVNVLASFDWAIANRDRYNIKVLNNSWGPGYGTPYDPDHPVNLAIDAAWSVGITCVFGAGNDGPKIDSLNAFSVNPHAISAAGSRKDGHQAFFSSRGVPGSPFWHPTVATPGENIVSVRNFTGLVSHAGDASSANPDPIATEDTPFYANANGTSMASPHVAGVVALMQEAAFKARGTYLTPTQVKDILQNTARKDGPNGLPNYQHWETGAGLVDAKAAVEAAVVGNAPAYDDGVTYDVRTFTGDVGAAAFVNTAAFSSTFEVKPGAISLEVMADWKTHPNDVDIVVTSPSGATRGTQLLCTGVQPNGYSSFCSSAPSERLSFPNPEAGVWKVDVAGFATGPETVHGMWSAVYPDGTSGLAVPEAPASLSLLSATPASVQGTADALTLSVRDAAGNPVPNARVVWSSTGAGRVVNAEDWTASDGGAGASALSDAPGTQVVTATVGALSASVSVTWVGLTAPCVTCGSGPSVNTPGKASGGGWFVAGSGSGSGAKRHLGFGAEYNAGAAMPGGTVTYDDKAGTAVSAEVVDRFRVSGSTAVFSGPAKVNGSSGYRYEVTVTDNGEPGRNDRFEIRLTRPADPLWSYSAAGTLGGGNLQVSTG